MFINLSLDSQQRHDMHAQLETSFQSFFGEEKHAADMTLSEMYLMLSAQLDVIVQNQQAQFQAQMKAAYTAGMTAGIQRAIAGNAAGLNGHNRISGAG